MANGYEVLDGALESIASAGPDLRNGLTNHAPMAIEALCAMGRGDAVTPWLDRYRAELLPWPDRHAHIEPRAWREALGRPERSGDWRLFFRNELEEAPWSAVLDRWVALLAPAICSAATHGVIRVGHAVRALARAQTPARVRELGDALASWAATYQVLPTDLNSHPAPLRPSDAILQVPIVPESERRFSGTITGSLEALDVFPVFAPVIGLADLDGEPTAVISELSATFARVYLANAHDFLSTIVFIHGVTSVAALRPMLPHLGAETTRSAVRYAWQAGCSLYAAFGHRPGGETETELPRESPDELVEDAIRTGDEHAIKFTEACLRETALSPSPAFRIAARHAVTTLKNTGAG